MKRIFLFLIVILSFILSGCGGTGGDANGNTPPPTATVSTSVTSFEAAGNRFNALLNITATQVAKSTKIELNNFTINSINGCSVSNYTFNGLSDINLEFANEGETHSVTVEGDFNCPSNSILDAKDIQIFYNKWISNSDGSKKRGPFQEAVNLGTPNSNNGDSNIQIQYSIYPDKELIVENLDETYNINVGVSITDENGTHPALNTKVHANFINPKFGTLQSYTATTDSSGNAHFVYSPPKTLDGISGSISILFYIDGMPNSTAKTDIIFKKPSQQRYTLHPDKEVIVKTPNTEYTINVALSTIGDNGAEIPATNQIIKANFIDPKFGTLKSYNVATNESGIAIFKYVSPKDIQNLTDTKITFYLKDDTSNSADTKILFSAVSDNKEYLIYPDEELVIDTPKKRYPINVAVSLVGENNKVSPAVGVDVKAQFLQPMFGKLLSYTVQTDASGVATFTYESPLNIQNLSNTDISFYIGNSTQMGKKTKLKFIPKGEDGATKLYLIPKNIQITTAGEKQTIKVITVNSKNLGRSATVEFEQLINGDGNNYGSLSKTEINTDANGEGLVEYTAPDKLVGQPKRVINVHIKDTNISEKLTFNFVSSETPPAEDNGIKTYELDIDTPKTISIEQNSSIAITIHRKGYPDQLIDDENVKSVTLTIEDKNLLQFTQNPDSDTYEYKEEASKSVSITTKTLAGVAIIDVKAVVFNGKNDTTLEATIPLTIMSGPISSISLNYIKTIADGNNGLFYDIYNVHAVDKYANPANPGAKFHPTLICGGNWSNAKDAATVLPKKADSGSAKIEQDLDEQTILTETQNSQFNKLDLTRDRLIVLPSTTASKKDYIGGWSIFGINGNSLILKEDYYGAQENGLRYVVGDEDRLLNDEVHVAHVLAMDESSDYKIDENGTAQIKIIYDPDLVGHTYSLAVTSYDDNIRTGTAVRQSFRGNGYVSGDSVLVPSGGTVKINYLIRILTPTGATVHLDNADLVPRSFTTSPDDKCWISGSDSNFHIEGGAVPLDISAVTTDNGKPVKCEISWVNNNSGIIHEY